MRLQQVVTEIRPMDKYEQVAMICHEANRAYCLSIGDTSQPMWDMAPEWQRDSAIKGVHFHLEELATGRTPSPAASHDSWLAEKSKEGWKYGPIKDPEKKEHPCYVPYGVLPVEQKLKDYIFGAIVKAFWEAEIG